MMRVNVAISNERFPELINRTLMGERIIIEQEGKAAAAIITYLDLQRFETLEALLKKAEQEEYDWLKTAIRNPAFESLKNSLKDGKAFDDPLFPKTLVSNPSLSQSLTEQEEDLYTIKEGKPYHDKG
jgi:antitoxin (DNA-binding transcriptional repressor) of toxin-antitoxin stability system